MISIVFGRKKFRFKSSFSEFDLENTKAYMSAYQDYDAAMLELEDNTRLVAGMDSVNYLRLQELSAKNDEIIMQIHSAKIAILQSVCTSKTFTQFCEDTRGVDYEIINQAAHAVTEKLGNFDTFWDNCPPVNSFKHRAKKKLFAKNYCLNEMDENTLLRTHLATMQLKQAFVHKEQLDSGKWDDICSFCAVIVRPLLQSTEIGSKGAFVQHKELKGMNHADRLSYYSQLLEKQQKELTKAFENLSLPVAIGLIKEFWKKKMKSRRIMTRYTSQAVK